MLDMKSVVEYLPSFSFQYNIRIHLRVQSAFRSLQEMPYYPLTFDKIPPLLVEPFIIHGFRSLYQPWSYYWKSLFHKHNESINVWTHLMAIVYIIYLFSSYSQRFISFENAHSWPFVVALFTTTVMFTCSTFAHLFHSKSESVHTTCFLIDFIGVSLHGFGSGFFHIYYSAPQWYYEQIQSYYVSILLLLAISACFLNCFSQYYFQRPYPPIKRFVQLSPCGLLWLYSIMPFCIRLCSSSIFSNSTLICHLVQIIVFIIGGLFFGLDIPQRFWPGAVDFIGQGHHLFHVCIYFVSICQMHGVYWDYQEFEEIIHQRIKPTLMFCAGSVFFLIVADLIIVCYFHRKIHHKFHKQ